jgi:hypothetical protein
METANPIGSERTKTKAGQSEEVKESGVAKVKVIDEEKFAACVKATAPSSWTANWDEAARYVAKLANLKTPTLIASSTTLGEMFLQQVLYPPITALLYVFRPNLYCAGEMVACFETIMSKHGGLSCAALCELDGGIRLVEKFYAIAVMELKSFWNDALPNRGPYKCIVMTAMAAVYIHKARVENQEMDDPSMELAVPFIIGKHSLVNLYVMRMVGDRPIVQWIDSISFGSPGAETKKAQFIASLAVIVRDIVILCNKLDFSSHFFSSEITPIDLTALPNAIPSIQTGNPERKHPPEGDGDNPTKKTKADDVGGAGGQHADGRARWWRNACQQ